jgi:hypothetical protein
MEDTPRPSAPTLYHRLDDVDSIRLCVLQPGQLDVSYVLRFRSSTMRCGMFGFPAAAFPTSTKVQF